MGFKQAEDTGARQITEARGQDMETGPPRQQQLAIELAESHGEGTSSVA